MDSRPTRRFARERRSPAEVLIDAVWQRRPRASVRDAELTQAVLLAHRNGVSGRLARIYPARLRQEVQRAEAGNRAFSARLSEASQILASADIRHTLIRVDPRTDDAHGTVDLVVSPEAWEDAIDVLRPLSARIAAPPRERDKLLIHTPAAPAIRLQRSVSWFDARVLSAAELERRAVPVPMAAWLVPERADALVIAIAQIAFQAQEITLGEALALRPLLGLPVVDEAADRAASSGWGNGFMRVLDSAHVLMAQLDAGTPVKLPWPLPIGTRYLVGTEHAAAAWRSRARSTAVRDVTLWPTLVGPRRNRALTGRLDA